MGSEGTGTVGRHRLLAILTIGLLGAGLGGWAIISHVVAAGTPVTHVQSYAAATFVPVESSTHNNNGNTTCAAFVPSQPGGENKGDLNAKKGSFLENVNLPQGATVTQLTLFANDFDADDGTHVFLVRKEIKGGLSPQFNGYRVMAATQSKGAVLNTMRKFTDTSINVATVNNTRFYYYLELVNCATVEPFDVQVAYTR
ncbi:MAG: hypothetical protein E6G49_08575 [Actinobacteria bacterium]|jgi:hypothetical protein|nr:MAG: hypothetical protein E6G49_08575 [Actinomycetota bacterium]